MALDYYSPGVYVEEVDSGFSPITARSMSVAGFVGVSPDANAFLNDPIPCENFGEFREKFCQSAEKTTPLAQAVYAFFENGGSRCFVVNVGAKGNAVGGGPQEEGLDVLKGIDEIALVAIPGDPSLATADALLTFCENRKDCFAIIDAPEVARLESLLQVGEVKPAAAAPATEAEGGRTRGPAKVEALGVRRSDMGAVYAPGYYAANVMNPREEVLVAPSGAVAGIYAQTDAVRGVHKAPANVVVRGVRRLSRRITHEQQKRLNEASVNVIRWFSHRGPVLWGARTLASKPEWRYVPVRRTHLMVNDALSRGLDWTVFEPNDVGLWMNIKRNLDDFLGRLRRTGALAGATDREAYFIKCDREVNTPATIEAGQVIVVVGLAVVRPAEFVVVRIGQHRGGVEITEGAA